MSSGVNQRRSGRPRAIPPALIPQILAMYGGGLGYRSISRELEKSGLCVDWSTVRRAIKASSPGSKDRASGRLSATVLPLGPSDGTGK